MSNGFQQLLGVIFGIILLRELTPGDYGMVGMLAIFSGIANTIQESGFTAALTNRQIFDPKDYTAVFWFNVILGSFFYIVLFFCAPLIARFYEQPELIPLSRILFLAIITGSLGIAHNAVLFRELMVKERAKIDVFSAVISGSTGITLAILGFGYWALAIQTLVHSGMGTILRWAFSPWRPNFCFYFRPIREMFGFSSKMLLSTIIAQIQANIFSVLIGRFYTVADVGYYQQGTKWSNMGGQVINGMIFNVSQPIFVQVRNDENRTREIFRKMIRFVSFVAFPSLFGLAFISRDFISIINAEFLPAVPILQMYCVWGCLLLFQTLYSQLIIVHNRVNIFLWGTIVNSILQIVVSCILYPYGLYWIAFGNVVSFFMFMIMYAYVINRCIQISFFSIIKDILP